jgi:hypothetical protein
MEAIWVLVYEEDGAPRAIPPDHAKEDEPALSTATILYCAQHKKDCGLLSANLLHTNKPQ